MIKFNKFKGADDMEQDILETSESVAEQSERSPEEIAREINWHLMRTAENFIEIGKLLLEAKTKVSHGEWGNWLKENISFSHQTANKFMQVAQRFSNYASTRNFNSAQMFELLPLPKKHTEDFFAEKDNAGVALEKLTEKELRQEVKAWKEKFHSPRKTKENVASDTSTEKNSELIHSVENFLKDGLALIDTNELMKGVVEYAADNKEQIKNDIEKIIQALQTVKDSI